jgi:4-amino-4-deoxy-L-arabinose transferase-like glycosyltransferase
VGHVGREAAKKNEPGLSRRLAASAYRLNGLVAALGVAGFAFVLYLGTLAPTVLYYERPELIDAAMLQVHSYVLGITQPTGYPTWTMLAHLFTYLPFGDPAYRANLASAVFGAAAVFVLFFAGWLLSKRIWAAAAGSLAFAVGNIFWSQAVIAEVYTLNALFVAAIVFVLLLWRNTRRDRYLLAAAFLVGLSLTNHVTSGLLLPTAALFVFAVDRRKLLDWRLVLGGAGLFVLGLAPYLYLPVRALIRPPVYEADPSSFAEFWELVAGREFGIRFWTFGPDEFLSRLVSVWGYLLEEFHPALLLVAAVGVVVMLLRDRAGTLLLGIPFLGWLVYAIGYDIFDYFIYFIPSYLMLALFVAVGAAAILEGAERLVAGSPPLLRTATPGLVSIALLYLAVADVGEDYSLEDRSQDLMGRRIVEAVAEKTAPDATILHHRSPLPYMILVEERRADLTLVSPWYPAQNPMRVWSVRSTPDEEYPAAKSVGSNGVADARVAARKGPVYALGSSIDLCNFQNTGFSVVRVEGDLFYEIVPPGSAAYTSPEEQQGTIVEPGHITDETASCS